MLKADLVASHHSDPTFDSNDIIDLSNPSILSFSIEPYNAWIYIASNLLTATRDLAIINQLELESCKVVSGSSAIQFFEKNNIKAVDAYSPPNFEVQNGKLEKSLKWLWSYYKYYKKCKEVSEQIISSEKPNLIISDEDFASIAAATDRGQRMNAMIADRKSVV